MIIPQNIRDGIRDSLWETADELGWSSLSDVERSRYYELWTRDPAIGGQLAHFMDPRKVRVYIKDSLIKAYERNRLSESEAAVWELLRVPAPLNGVCHVYIKPHGRRLEGGKVVCWGKSRDWKLILMATFERGHAFSDAVPYGVVLWETGQTSEPRKRSLVKLAAKNLGIQKLEWME
ncbi:hypothetical protein [Kordiimonas aestuarii]|uniref:hypothetical protein n=1 Tax=Kordiimonas aestuarii TaxID=1005925 RepID=UPI0021CFFB75|nr:hypothetical protein [Kordiimonas aestuarii]